MLVESSLTVARSLANRTILHLLAQVWCLTEYRRLRVQQKLSIVPSATHSSSQHMPLGRDDTHRASPAFQEVRLCRRYSTHLAAEQMVSRVRNSAPKCWSRTLPEQDRLWWS